MYVYTCAYIYTTINTPTYIYIYIYTYPDHCTHSQWTKLSSTRVEKVGIVTCTTWFSKSGCSLSLSNFGRRHPICWNSVEWLSFKLFSKPDVFVYQVVESISRTTGSHAPLCGNMAVMVMISCLIISITIIIIIPIIISIIIIIIFIMINREHALHSVFQPQRGALGGGIRLAAAAALISLSFSASLSLSLPLSLSLSILRGLASGCNTYRPRSWTQLPFVL